MPESDTRRIRIVVSYDGTDFHGWQRQPDRVSIQQVMEEVLAEIFKEPVAIAGSGRTDAGVHALAQVAAFNISNGIPCDNLRKALNRLLPHSIRVLNAYDAPPEFHPRFDAIAKLYEYRIWREEICPPFDRRYVHHHPYALDEERMAQAARVFEGEHDFSAFAASDPKDAKGFSKRRSIYYSRLRRQGALLSYRVQGSGFLKHMVRNMAGTLIEIGKGNLDEEGVQRFLSGEAEGKAGPTAPACGLFLVAVSYP